MSWSWGPSNWMWQIANNPGQLLDAHYAKGFYGQMSTMGINTGHGVVASVYDVIGGLIPGQAATLGQVHAQIAWGLVPGFNLARNFFGVFINIGEGNNLGAALSGLGLWGNYLGSQAASYGAPGFFKTDLSTGNLVWLNNIEKALLAAEYQQGSQILSLVGWAKGIASELNWNTATAAQQFGGPYPGASTQAKNAPSGMTNAKHTQRGPPPKSLLKKTKIYPPGPPPPPPPHQGAGVGGILFKKCAALLTELGEISGAYWDAVTGSLVLIGRDSANNDAVRLGLPTMDRDHLAVALRASFAGQAMGVSIDPEAKYRDGMMRGVTPPDDTPMLVSYLGNTEGTLFGAIMFEADRLLKCLDKGVDNETRKPLKRTIPGFKPLLEMIHPSDGRPQNVWHRFWFVIDKVELKRDPVSGAIAFGDVRLKVLTETELEGQAKGQYVDPADEAFVRHLTDHYDDYAQAFPILARLKELAKVAAVAKFLVDQGIPLNIEALFTLPTVKVKTPDSTPGISRTSPNVEVRREGNVIHTRRVSLFGGVDIDADPHILPDDGTARRLKEMAELSRLTPTASSWTFGKNGSASQALASRIGQSRNPFRRFCDDHCFLPGGDEDSLRLRRLYDSSTLHRGDFGPGWSLWVPFSISVIAPSGKRPEVITQKELDEREKHNTNPVLVLHDRKAARSDTYRFVDDQAAFCRVTSQARNKTQTSFKYDPSDCIAKKGDCFMLTRDGCLYFFEGSGQLLEVQKGNICLARYVRKDSRIIRIADGSNRSYDVRYEGSEAARIVEVIPSSGPSILYSYDRRGLLAACDGAKAQRYSYDSNSLLTEVKGHSGRVISRAVYSQFGDLVKTQSDIVTDWAGGRIMRAFEQGKAVSLKDESGGTQLLRYGTQDELAEIQIGDRVNGVWKVAYDSAGRLAGLRDPLGHTTSLQHEESGRVTRCVGPRGDSRTYQMDDRGRLSSVADQDGRRWTFEYDKDGNLTRTRGPGDMRWEYEYSKQMLVKVSGPTGAASVKAKKETLEMKSVAPSGMWQESVCDWRGRLVRTQAKGAKPVRFAYADDGRSFAAVTECGMVQYQANDKELTIDVVFK